LSLVGTVTNRIIGPGGREYVSYAVGDTIMGFVC
jgi:hypothetical protein